MATRRRSSRRSSSTSRGTETTVERFGLQQEAAFRAWLAQQPRALVLYRGEGCPYSETFEKVFAEEPAEGWARAIRMVEEGGEGPIADALAIDVTPTVGAWREGREERLEARIGLGITRKRYRAWITKL